MSRLLIRSFGDQQISGKRKKVLKEKNYQPRILYQAKVPFKSKGEIKEFTDKQRGNSWPLNFPARNAQGISGRWNEETLDNKNHMEK